MIRYEDENRVHYNKLVDVNEELYLYQGCLDESDNQILMIRTVDNLLECERGEIQKMLEDK